MKSTRQQLENELNNARDKLNNTHNVNRNLGEQITRLKTKLDEFENAEKAEARRVRLAAQAEHQRVAQEKEDLANVEAQQRDEQHMCAKITHARELVRKLNLGNPMMEDTAFKYILWVNNYAMARLGGML